MEIIWKKMINYNVLNLRCGIECHQQLSGKKLFCSCSTNLQEHNEEIQIRRKLRAVAGESGKKDIAAVYEEKKDRTYIYHGYEGEYCLVDTDSEPIHNINQDALETALAVSKLLKFKIPKELKVMRKLISDGSVTSSFQRLVICGMESKDSYLETSQGKVRLTLLSLEEDACKIIKTEKNNVHFSLSRLGIPLLELTTKADIKSPDHAKEVAEMIGMIFRSFPLTRRGLGTIRQDVNLSIKNGARVELKGFQDIRQMPKVIDLEIERQLSLMKQRKKVQEEVRRVTNENKTRFLRPLPGEARIYPETDIQTLPLTKQFLSSIKIPKLLTEKTLALERKYNIINSLAREILKEEKLEIFEGFLKEFKLQPSLIANIIIEIPKEIKKRFKINKEINNDQFLFVLKALSEKKITKDVVLDILVDLLNGKKVSLQKYKSVNVNLLEKDIEKIVKENKDASLNAIMGLVMGRYKGKVDAKEVVGIIKKFQKV